MRISPDPECVHFGKVTRRNSESVTVAYETPDGKRVSVPWNPDHPKTVAATRKQGLVRVEYRGAVGERALAKKLDAQDHQRHRHNQESEHRVFGPSRQRIREDLKDMVRTGIGQVGDRTVQLSEQGRDFARAALGKLDSGYSKRFDPGNHRE